MAGPADIPYKVTKLKHERTFMPDGNMGGQYHVEIQHASGVQTSFVVPEGPTAAQDAHKLAMQQVNEAQSIKNLPAGGEASS